MELNAVKHRMTEMNGVMNVTVLALAGFVREAEKSQSGVARSVLGTVFALCVAEAENCAREAYSVRLVRQHE
jgi:hypothetical protein